MRFLGGAEIPFDADVELLGAALKPQPASESERRRLGQLAETEQLAEKVTCLSLAAGWCSKLHMVDSLKWVGLRHGARSVPSSIGTPADAEIVARLFLSAVARRNACRASRKYEHLGEAYADKRE
jgi:hypothetical protein